MKIYFVTSADKASCEAIKKLKTNGVLFSYFTIIDPNSGYGLDKRFYEFLKLKRGNQCRN